MGDLRRASMIFVVLLMVGISLAAEPQSVDPIESLFALETLPLLRSNEKCKMFSSYDRTGGNNDGFSGTYSKLREENGNSVIAEMEGAGCIQRIWFTHSVINIDGLLDREGEHIMVYLDGETSPTIDVPLEQIFSGELEQFPAPLVGSDIGGFYCYVPIPYNDGCKVVIEGLGVRFYQITYTEYPKSKGIESFSMQMRGERKALLNHAVDVWSNLGDLSVLEINNLKEIEYKLISRAPSAQINVLPVGKNLIRGITLNADNASSASLLKSRIVITWDNQDTPAVDMPVAAFFAMTNDPPPWQSLLMGASEKGFYNYFPMPYFDWSEIEIISEEDFNGSLKVTLQPLPWAKDDIGYFHANYIEELPTEDGMPFTFINAKERGHYVGVYHATIGGPRDPIWLEGDEQFIIDDELAIHGTGTEDFFNCGWYSVPGRLDSPGALPLHGYPVFERTSDTMNTASYRWHISDVVPFNESIDFKIEHGPGNDFSADYRAAVYFYSPTPGKIESMGTVLTGDEIIRYLDLRVGQFAQSEPERAIEVLDKLAQNVHREEIKILIEGLRSYFKGILNPSEENLEQLNMSLAKLDDIIEASPPGDLYDAPVIKLATDSDNPIPKSIVNCQSILRKARYDLERRLVHVRGYKPGDEIVIESRDAWGEVTESPCYVETDEFTNSYAKVSDERLLGKGARFTYGGVTPSWARFTPEFTQDGNYEVLVIFSYGANADDTRYLVNHADGATTIALRQRGRPGTPGRNNKTWHSLGRFNFEQGCNAEKGSVTLHAFPGVAVGNEDLEYRAYADSIRFVYRGKISR